ncbi:MAG: chloride channel protein [Pontibacterium sp.]
MLRNHSVFEQLRNQFSRAEALPQLIALGLMAGLLTGIVICGFRLCVDYGQMYLLPSGKHEDFESLPSFDAFLLPIMGSILLGLLLFKLKPHERRTGPVHVLERMGYHQGRLPLINLVVQFVGGSIALISGHSVGREGPSIHLGAGVSSLAGQQLGLSSNTLRLLVGCGTAASIAAAFNTPLAGVIFAMEVVMLEYTVAGFLPIVAAAVAGDLVVRLTLGAEIDLTHSVLPLSTIDNLPYIIVIGLFTGVLATVFSKLLETTVTHVKLPIIVKLLLAGLIAGGCAFITPQIMGVGYDTLADTIQGNFTLILIAAILVAKLCVTPITLGLGVPGGLIGPSFLIGALAGALVGGLIGSNDSPLGYYAMIGMAAMTAALLHAPLAALVALLELTDSPYIILPGMIAIVVSCLVNQHFFKRPSVFLTSLRALGLDYRYEPITQTLLRQSVLDVMSSRFIQLGQHIPHEFDGHLLSQHDWVLLKNDDEQMFALSPVDLVNFLTTYTGDQEIDLMKLPAFRADLIAIASSASLYDALHEMDKHHVDMAYVASSQGLPMGIVTRSQIQASYQTFSPSPSNK